ncbi:hypothetical protein GWK48_02940 [Metallosphaera tengchongensis]|uniref:Uncharacterized protein n=1 Tax=Metallosphaera tengchongensis TaxID=1532350 RepID=A0A6N0NTN7_9CREN|nr:hypothetical protein [Metallosphaera tengchongensis]QKQ99486.1 hypothetical protein GWK48_02940 [Metallosphaera tengchongensis]
MSARLPKSTREGYLHLPVLEDEDVPFLVYFVAVLPNYEVNFLRSQD